MKNNIRLHMTGLQHLNMWYITLQCWYPEVLYPWNKWVFSGNFEPNKFIHVIPYRKINRIYWQVCSIPAMCLCWESKCNCSFHCHSTGPQVQIKLQIIYECLYYLDIICLKIMHGKYKVIKMKVKYVTVKVHSC